MPMSALSLPWARWLLLAFLILFSSSRLTRCDVAHSQCQAALIAWYKDSARSFKMFEYAGVRACLCWRVTSSSVALRISPSRASLLALNVANSDFLPPVAVILRIRSREKPAGPMSFNESWLVRQCLEPVFLCPYLPCASPIRSVAWGPRLSYRFEWWDLERQHTQLARIASLIQHPVHRHLSIADSVGHWSARPSRHSWFPGAGGVFQVSGRAR